MFNIMVILGAPDRGTWNQVSQIIGALQVPGQTYMYLGQQWGREICFNVASTGHPLTHGGSKFTTHGTEQKELRGEQVGSEKHTKNLTSFHSIPYGSNSEYWT